MSVGAGDVARLTALADLPQAELERLAGAASMRRLADGEALFVAGQPADTVFGLARGQVVLRSAVSDRPTIVMSASAGEILGWTALRDDATWITSARSVGESEVIEIPVGALLDVLASGSPAARALIRRLFGVAAEHLATTQSQLLQRGGEGPITGG